MDYHKKDTQAFIDILVIYLVFLLFLQISVCYKVPNDSGIMLITTVPNGRGSHVWIPHTAIRYTLYVQT